MAGAILIQPALGALYAWSVFTRLLNYPEGFYRFTATQTAWIFSAGLATFALVMVLVGRNYGWVFTAYGVAGLLGPLLARVFKDSAGGAGTPSAWMTPFLIAAIACLSGAETGLCAIRREPSRFSGGHFIFFPGANIILTGKTESPFDRASSQASSFHG